MNYQVLSLINLYQLRQPPRIPEMNHVSGQHCLQLTVHRIVSIYLVASHIRCSMVYLSHLFSSREGSTTALHREVA